MRVVLTVQRLRKPPEATLPQDNTSESRQKRRGHKTTPSEPRKRVAAEKQDAPTPNKQYLAALHVPWTTDKGDFLSADGVCCAVGLVMVLLQVLCVVNERLVLWPRLLWSFWKALYSCG